MCAGSRGLEDAEFCFEHVNQAAIVVRNYISRDPDGMLKVLAGQQNLTCLDLTINFLKRCCEVNRESNDNNGLAGIAIVSIIVALFENMDCRLDE